MILQKGDRGVDVKHMQEYLTALGYDTKGVDGIFGNNTQKALSKLPEEERFVDNSGNNIINDKIAFYLLSSFWFKQDLKVPDWLLEASYDYLDKEVKGEKHNPEILRIWKDAKLGGIKDDETPWCAGAVSAWLERAGVRSMRTAWARNYLEFGEKLLEPRFGCIVVFERGKGGHVGFVTGISEDGKMIRVLGGNQGDCVNERMFPTTRVLGYRQPEGVVLSSLPIVGKSEQSTNEA